MGEDGREPHPVAGPASDLRGVTAAGLVERHGRRIVLLDLRNGLVHDGRVGGAPVAARRSGEAEVHLEDHRRLAGRARVGGRHRRDQAGRRERGRGQRGEEGGSGHRDLLAGVESLGLHPVFGAQPASGLVPGTDPAAARPGLASLVVMLDLRELAAPVLGAPMAGGASTPALAAAVSAAGGLGFLAAGYKTADQLAVDVEAVRTATAEPFGVNLFLVAPFEPDPESLSAYRRVPGAGGRTARRRPGTSVLERRRLAGQARAGPGRAPRRGLVHLRLPRPSSAARSGGARHSLRCHRDDGRRGAGSCGAGGCFGCGARTGGRWPPGHVGPGGGTRPDAAPRPGGGRRVRGRGAGGGRRWA